jgi:hypothetical protein
MNGKRKGKGEKPAGARRPESVHGATGREMAATEPGRNPHTGRPRRPLAEVLDAALATWNDSRLTAQGGAAC